MKHYPSYTKQHQGFSLVELLVAMGIFLVLLAALTTSWIRTSDLVGGMVVESDLVEDTRNASAIMADGLARAVYVYPPGADLELNGDSSQLVHNVETGDNIFRVGNYVGAEMSVTGLDNITIIPAIAFLETAQDPNAPCDLDDDNEAGCLTFVAYYFAKREYITRESAFTFLQDDNNNDKWMLLEYRRATDLRRDFLLERPIPTTFSNGQAQLLVDYIDPKYLVIDYQKCASGDVDAPLQDCPPRPSLDVGGANFSAVHGLVRMRSGVSRRGGRKTYLSPEITFAITPENLVNALIR